MNSSTGTVPYQCVLYHHSNIFFVAIAPSQPRSYDTQWVEKPKSGSAKLRSNGGFPASSCRARVYWHSRGRVAPACRAFCSYGSRGMGKNISPR